MSKTPRFDLPLVISMCFLITLSFFILKSIAPNLFPGYLLLILLSILAFILFSFLDFDILSLFSRHFYIGSISLLVLTLLAGRITRGVVRWIPLGALTLQAAEITKPFLLIFFANNFFRKYTIPLMIIPLVLILVQPSFGVTFLLAIGFLGIFLALSSNKKHFLYLGIGLLVLLPLVFYLLAPYQKSRILSFLKPSLDPQGAGYNSIQSVISVGSGGSWGRGLGKGIQTQLSFLPEKQTDFVFAAISEELGFVGSVLTISAIFLILWRLTVFMNQAKSPEARAYLSGLFATILAQVVIHVGMNLGILPITGIPFPLVSAGGSSLLATMIGLGIAQGTRKR
jgi:rod shape determining protein RodA